MGASWREVEVVKRTYRFEVESPANAAVPSKMVGRLRLKFEEIHGRKPEYDDDYWIEPIDVVDEP